MYSYWTIDCGVSIYYGKKALYYAANEKLAQLLLKHGADVKARGPLRITLLHQVASHQRYELALVKLYIDKEVSVQGVDDFENTPLHKLIQCFSEYTDKQCMLKKARMLLSVDQNLKTKRNKEGQVPIDIFSEKVITAYAKGSKSKSSLDLLNEPVQTLLRELQVPENTSIIKR